MLLNSEHIHEMPGVGLSGTVNNHEIIITSRSKLNQFIKDSTATLGNDPFFPCLNFNFLFMWFFFFEFF